MDTALIVTVVVALTAWVFLLRSSMISMIWGPVVRSAGGDAVWAAVTSVVLYIAGLAAFALVVLAVHWALGGLPARALVLVLSVLYAPVAFMPAPDRGARPYEDVRRTLVRAGATEEQARACAWATGPLAFAGLAVVGGAVISVFAG